MSRWTASLIGLALMVGVLAACDPYPPPPAGMADVDITVRTDGTAEMDVHLPLASDQEQLAEAAARAVFPAAGTVRVTSFDNRGRPYPIVDIAGVYRPGPRVVLTIDTSDLLAELADAGITRFDLSVCVPSVPETMTATPAQDTSLPGCGVWEGLGDTPLRATIDMRPTPTPWWAEIGLTFVACALILAGLVVLAGASARVVRRIGAGILGAAVLVLCVVDLTVFAGDQADNLAVRGDLSGTPLFLAGLVSLPLLPMGLTAIALIVVAAFRGSLSPRRPAGPGWPAGFRQGAPSDSPQWTVANQTRSGTGSPRRR